MHKKNNRTPITIIVSILILGVLIGLALTAYTWVRHVDPIALIESSVVQQEIRKRVGDDNAPLIDLLPRIAGFSQERVYLLLFLNNTELRPGGGFIGSYAVARVRQGQIELVTLEGSEQLDRRTPATWKPTPPQPITEHLGVPQWYFRDANWDPDFAANALRILEFYREEGGVLADEIDIVAAIDTEVLTGILEILGPVSAAGQVFTAENVVELLQYDTSYGFSGRDIPFEDRKQILDALFADIQSKLPRSLIMNYGSYIDLLDRLIVQKHIQLFSTDQTEQQIFETRGIAGRVVIVPHDYLLWIDANLAALKTDWAIQRTLSYSFARDDKGRMLATVAMTYRHTGTFDWRTSRYRTYARIFVPIGSELVSTSGDMLTDRSPQPGRIDQGSAFDKQWFGTFISIEPGDTKTLSFTYVLPEYLFSEESYQLLIQKQAGIPSFGLTLDLEFDTTIRRAAPAEVRSEWGDTQYRYSFSDIRTDQVFMVEY